MQKVSVFWRRESSSIAEGWDWCIIYGNLGYVALEHRPFKKYGELSPANL